VPGARSIFRNIEKLPPAHTLMLTADRLQQSPRRYWQLRIEPDERPSVAEWVERIEAKLDETVRLHLIADVPVGAFLSGGTDSSTVVGLMTRVAHCPVKAFSIGFQEQPFNELGYAEIAAKKFHADHHTYLVGADDCFEALPQMIRCFDEPFGNSSAIPTYFCARLAAQHGVKVLLAGDGGDELFGGNERYLIDKIFEVYHNVPATLRQRLIEPVLARLPMERGLVGRARGYVRRANMPAVERMLSFQFLRTHAPADVFNGDFDVQLLRKRERLANLGLRARIRVAIRDLLVDDCRHQQHRACAIRLGIAQRLFESAQSFLANGRVRV